MNCETTAHLMCLAPSMFNVSMLNGSKFNYTLHKEHKHFYKAGKKHILASTFSKEMVSIQINGKNCALARLSKVTKPLHIKYHALSDHSLLVLPNGLIHPGKNLCTGSHVQAIWPPTCQLCCIVEALGFARLHAKKKKKHTQSLYFIGFLWAAVTD